MSGANCPQTFTSCGCGPSLVAGRQSLPRARLGSGQVGVVIFIRFPAQTRDPSVRHPPLSLPSVWPLERSHVSFSSPNREFPAVEAPCNDIFLIALGSAVSYSRASERVSREIRGGDRISLALANIQPETLGRNSTTTSKVPSAHPHHISREASNDRHASKPHTVALGRGFRLVIIPS